MATQTMTPNAKCRELAAIWAELEQESKATQRVLEQVPENQLNWRPHPKGMSMGQLAIHIAGLPMVLQGILDPERFDGNGVDFVPKQPASKSQILETFNTSLQNAKEILAIRDSAWAHGTWSFSMGDQVIVTQPRLAVMRWLLLNHIYHHRGQLTTYLRATGQRVPSVYGPSADDNPFA